MFERAQSDTHTSSLTITCPFKFEHREMDASLYSWPSTSSETRMDILCITVLTTIKLDCMHALKGLASHSVLTGSHHPRPTLAAAQALSMRAVAAVIKIDSIKTL